MATNDPMRCKHEHLADACEVCAYEEAKRAGLAVPPQLLARVNVPENAEESDNPAVKVAMRKRA